VVPGWERLDAAEGLDNCVDDFDEAGDLQVSSDGSTVFASLATGGLFRILPSVLPISPDVTEYFQLHPDGAVMVAVASDQGSSGLLRVYKIFPEQARHGAVRLSDLAPCAPAVRIPNNRGSGRTGTVINFPFAVGRAASGGNDAVVLVNFITAGGGRDAVLSATLRIQGTAAFVSPGGSPTCTFLGFINLDFLEYLTF
jgi:hypothetical protein